MRHPGDWRGVRGNINVHNFTPYLAVSFKIYTNSLTSALNCGGFSKVHHPKYHAF